MNGGDEGKEMMNGKRKGDLKGRKTVWNMEKITGNKKEKKNSITGDINKVLNIT